MKKTIIQSIGFKILLFYFLLTLINVSFVVSIIFENQVDLISQNVQFKSERQFSQLIDAAKQYTAEMKQGTLFSHIDNRESIDRFIEIISPYAPQYAIITEKNRVLKKSDASFQVPATLTQDMMRAAAAKNFSGRDYYLRIDEKKKKIYCYVLLGGPQTEQTALLSVRNISLLDASMKNLYNQAVFVIIVVLFFHAIFALALFRYIINPLKALNDGAIKLSEGDYKVRISLSGRDDELGALAQSFNTMADSIYTNIKNMTADVEKAVELKNRTDLLAVKDEFTGLYNRIYMNERIQEEAARSRINKKTTALVFAVVDKFNDISVVYGPKSGDIIMLEISKIITKHAADTDIVSRFGTDMFAVLSPDCSPERIREVSECIRADVEKKTIITPDGQFTMTVSIGAAVQKFDSSQAPKTETEFIASAEAALSRAVKAGRNRVEIIG
ncbi:MAG TPA: diguanylate cyclase [Spirochaetota bacterium]|nr:diguanylate cyclase [Spirochaetota bacterium]HPR48343.1 diguanylate cyclase [Spirochaetota bacterium]